MNTTNRIQISGDFDRLFSLAADIARWPEILPHYRYVTVLEKQGTDLKAVMAARHRGLPLWWKTTLRPRRHEKRIYFTHIGGITKGMEVYWSFEPVGDSCNGPTWLVQIHHEFNPAWPRVIGPWFAEKIVGGMFVQQVANKTLQRMKEISESTS
jgi:ribosome-associated toxin RatA of RatAB toxin-antitoxin module